MNSFVVFNHLEVAQANSPQVAELLVYTRYLLARENVPENIEWLTKKRNELQARLLELEYQHGPSFPAGI